MKSHAPNINYFWADLIVEELVRNGVDYFCIAPGSRSSPLALAVAGNKRAKAVVHFDERGLAFHALGHSRGTGRAAAVITTSGTAVANLFPAVVEASLDAVPMILLTADRPPELRDTGANQTIDQVKLFGDNVRWFFDLPCPDTRIAPQMVLTTVDHAVHRARGPVHLNCMFREPLAPFPDRANLNAYRKPIAAWMAGNKPFTSHARSRAKPVSELQKILSKSRRGLVVVGALSDAPERRAAERIAHSLHWPVLPDVLSGLRLSKSVPHVIHHADLLLTAPNRYRPDTVLHIGGRILSRRVTELLAAARPKHYILISDTPSRLDPAHQVTLRFDAALTDLPPLRGRAESGPWRRGNARVEAVLDRFESGAAKLSEPLVARLVSRHLPAGHALFLGNSMPVRDMNMFGAVLERRIRVGGNRGASGIDGIIASGLGYGDPVTILLGDLAALHDLNSLALARGRRAVIVVLNNNGGGIFSFLPIARAGSHFEKYIGAPHGLSFKAAAEQFGLRYDQPRTKRDFMAAYRTAGESKSPTLIEVQTDRSENVAVHNGLQAAIRKALA